MRTEKEKSTHFYNLLKIGFLANAFEWYEFAVFNYLSITIAALFFSDEAPIIGLLKTFALTGISQFIRPLGSIAFGVIGDRLGRRYALNLSMILMTVPTVFIGLLPTYSQLGILATLSLLFLRLIQGFAMGGELPATACYVFETAEARDKSFLCSAVGAAPKIGLLLGALMNFILTKTLDTQALHTWGWRIPFLLGVPITFFVAYARRDIEETEAFSTSQIASRSTHWKEIDFKGMMKPLVHGLLVCSFLNVGYPIVAHWMPFYLHTFLHIPKGTAQLVNVFALLLMVPLCLLAGYLSQRFGYRRLLVTSLITTMILIVPIFMGLQIYKDNVIILLALQAILACLVSVSQGVFFEMANSLFKPQHRSLGMSLVSTIPASFIAGTVAVVCTAVVYKTEWLLFPAFYILISGFIALPATLRLKDWTTKE